MDTTAILVALIVFLVGGVLAGFGAFRIGVNYRKKLPKPKSAVLKKRLSVSLRKARKKPNAKRKMP